MRIASRSLCVTRTSTHRSTHSEGELEPPRPSHASASRRTAAAAGAALSPFHSTSVEGRAFSSSSTSHHGYVTHSHASSAGLGSAGVSAAGGGFGLSQLGKRHSSGHTASASSGARGGGPLVRQTSMVAAAAAAVESGKAQLSYEIEFVHVQVCGSQRGCHWSGVAAQRW